MKQSEKIKGQREREEDNRRQVLYRTQRNVKTTGAEDSKGRNLFSTIFLCHNRNFNVVLRKLRKKQKVLHN